MVAGSPKDKMKLQWIAAVVVAASIITQAGAAPGLDQDHPVRVSVAPISVSLSQTPNLSSKSRIELQSMDPKGRFYNVTDLHGQGQWSIETLRDGRILQIIPSPDTYAGPLRLKVDGRVVSRYGEMLPSSQGLVLQKVLSDRMNDGTILKVYYTDFSIEQIEDRSYPHRVLTLMKASYESLGRALRLAEHPDAKPRVIEAYIGDAEEGGLLPFGGFTLEDFRRAPLFMIRTDERTGQKIPALLLPANYKKFLEFWDRINRVPGQNAYTPDQYLATSIMHEMTHAVVHGFNENLGSTEHEIRGGDWYTEGLARYFECKIGSDAGFASEGFRQVVDGKVQFSRGGANYYLRYPDETFFTMRYENALFWMYLEKRFGSDAIVQITRELRSLPHDASFAEYAELLAGVTGEPFGGLLNDYFNWVYRGDYSLHKEGAKLLPVAATQSVWSEGHFFVYNTKGALVELTGANLRSDWVAGWGSDSAEKMSQSVAGDWTREADIKPLAFDAHKILISAPGGKDRTLRVENTSEASVLRVTVYLESFSGVRTVTSDAVNGGGAEFLIADHEKVSRAGVVIANLDAERPAAYQIRIS